MCFAWEVHWEKVPETFDEQTKKKREQIFFVDYTRSLTALE